MAQYRKKPVVIEAEQFFFTQSSPWPEGVTLGSNGWPVIQTLEGEMIVGDGDWVITGVKGEKYPCKPDIFAATYDAVEGDMFARGEMASSHMTDDVTVALTANDIGPETAAALAQMVDAAVAMVLRRQLAAAQAKIAADEIAFGKCAAEIEATHRQLAECQDSANVAWEARRVATAERDAARAELSNARTLLGDPVDVDIAIMGLLTERYNLQVDNAKLRFYVAELEAASRTIDMHLAQQAAREKYEAAFGDHAAEGRPIGVDRPGQTLCQLPEGHEGPHGHCEACNGTGELDNSPEYMRCPICHGSGMRQP